MSNRQKKIVKTLRHLNLPPQIGRRIAVDFLHEAPVTLFFKRLCIRLKQNQLPSEAQYEFTAKYFVMVIRIEASNSLSIAFEWLNGVRLDFPSDYLEDYNYTPEKLFSIFQLLYDTFSMKCSESFTKTIIQEYSKQYKRHMSHLNTLWDQSIVQRKSVRRDRIFLAVKALDPIASHGIRNGYP